MGRHKASVVLPSIPDCMLQLWDKLGRLDWEGFTMLQFHCDVIFTQWTLVARIVSSARQGTRSQGGTLSKSLPGFLSLFFFLPAKACGWLVLRLLCVFSVCWYIYLCVRTYHVRNNYVTYTVAMRPCLSRRLLCVATMNSVATIMSSLAQLRVRDRSIGQPKALGRG